MEVFCLIFLLTLVVFLVLFFIPFLLLLFLYVQYRVLFNILDRTSLYFSFLLSEHDWYSMWYALVTPGVPGNVGEWQINTCFRCHTNKPQDKIMMLHIFCGVHKFYISGLLGCIIWSTHCTNILLLHYLYTGLVMWCWAHFFCTVFPHIMFNLLLQLI